ncbi:MAG: FAD-dependent oxidoreductase [Bacteroidota bacterium]
MESKNIVIIGGGVAGLIAAQHLEQSGLQPTIIEATDRIGGRVKTDVVDGFRLDHGFQVLLTDYREAQRYLDYEDLALRYFRPGAVVMNKGKALPIVDPLREPTQLFQAALSPVGTLKDKFLTWRLQQQLKRKEVDELFTEANQQSSIAFLQTYGFSERFIQNFFRPFFGGIFLENQLQTPAAMLQFVFKMFAQGHAALPAKGMESIPQQLASQLKATNIIRNNRVQQIENNRVKLDDSTIMPYTHLIVATSPGRLLPQLAGEELRFHETTTMYFSAHESVLPKGLIALVNEEQCIVNNFCEPSTVSEEYVPAQKHLVSVTLKDIPTQQNIEEQVICHSGLLVN